MPTIHARRALCPKGWRHDVRLTHMDGRIVSVESGLSPGVANSVSTRCSQRPVTCIPTAFSAPWRA